LCIECAKEKFNSAFGGTVVYSFQTRYRQAFEGAGLKNNTGKDFSDYQIIISPIYYFGIFFKTLPNAVSG